MPVGSAAPGCRRRPEGMAAEGATLSGRHSHGGLEAAALALAVAAPAILRG
ncbi:MAG: hypothetical protein ACRDMX_11195 [Solirubrobacteraceae bacterium]